MDGKPLIMKKIKLKGSMTVEAAVLFPVILLVIVTLIYLTFYLHDSSKLQSKIHTMMLQSKSYMLYQTPLYGVNNNYEESLLEDSTEGIKILEDYVRTQFRKGFFIYRFQHIDMELKDSYIQLSVEGEIELPFAILEPLFSKVEHYKYIDRINIASTTSEIRFMTKLVETVKKLNRYGKEGEE